MINHPENLFARLAHFWRKDFAHKIFIIAAVMVLIAGGFFVVLATRTLAQNLILSGNNSAISQNLPTSAPPAGTVDLQPTFPTPSGGQGSTSSSQPPMQDTPVIVPTPVVTPSGGSPTPSPNPGGALTVQITNIPNVVQNNSRVQVDVQTSLPGATVRLSISYDTFPYYGQSGAQITDNNGNATLNWAVRVFKRGNFKATATVVAVAISQDGQRAVSAPVTVQVV